MGTWSGRLTRNAGSNFYCAFRLLPREKREAIYVLYAFCRVVDDCVDEDDGDGEAGLERWTEEVGRCYAGEPTTPLGEDLARAVSRFPIRRESLLEVIEGCRMDLTTARYPAYADLEVYCRRVASAVGQAAIEVFGYRNPETREFAHHLGLALQLTNILRDVAADAARGRLYLPLEDLARFEVAEEELLALAAGGGALRRPAVSALLAFEADRARAHYRRAGERVTPEDRRSLRSATAMGAIYRCLLGELERRGYPVGGPRVRLSRGRKLWIAARTLVGGGAVFA
jgi:phytoene synthase